MQARTKQESEVGATSVLGEAVREGLAAPQKWLPSMFLYDDVGSRLFEAICALPEYYLTRAETAVLEQYAAEIVSRLEPDTNLVEFGAGSAVKTRIIIEALLRRQEHLVYCPIDISEEAMRFAEANIRAMFPQIEFQGLLGEYAAALEELSSMKDQGKLILFLGSSVGNFTESNAIEFLTNVRRSMGANDRLLLGTDMAKSVDELTAAYDDAAGVTAAFDKNLLSRINQELGASFDLDRFRHEARWNEGHMRMEMHLVSTMDQTVRIEALDMEVRLAAGESIHTENSHKYTQQSVERLAAGAGLDVKYTWTDEAGRFALHLLAAE